MHMDDFDRQLELELARLLDPIVAAPAPRRRRPGLVVLQPEMTVPVELVPAAVVAPVGPAVP